MLTADFVWCTTRSAATRIATDPMIASRTANDAYDANRLVVIGSKRRLLEDLTDVRRQRSSDDEVALRPEVHAVVAERSIFEIHSVPEVGKVKPRAWELPHE